MPEGLGDVSRVGHDTAQVVGNEATNDNEGPDNNDEGKMCNN